MKEEWEKELDDLANSLSAPQSKSTPKKNSIKKGKANSAKQKSQQATSSNQPSVESVTPAEPAATALTPENWNNYFAPFFSDEDDGSRVVSIDVKNKKFIINDPSRHENLIAFASKIPHFSFKNIGKLDFDKRIIERQAADLDETTRHSHSFARMLDYVIQYVGDIVPFLQLGKDVKTTLNAQVIRQDTNTGLEIPCTAEYTFGKNFNATRTNNFPVIYHRLLRANKRQPAQPIKKKLLINQASSSNQK